MNDFSWADGKPSRKGLQVPSKRAHVLLRPETFCAGTSLKAKHSWRNHTQREATHPATEQFTHEMMRGSGQNSDCSQGNAMIRGANQILSKRRMCT